MRRLDILVFLFALLAALAHGQTGALRSFAAMPQVFEPNRGQAPQSVDFTSHGPGYALSLKFSLSLPGTVCR